jgi:hypothetical protein
LAPDVTTGIQWTRIEICYVRTIGWRFGSWFLWTVQRVG